MALFLTDIIRNKKNTTKISYMDDKTTEQASKLLTETYILKKLMVNDIIHPESHFNNIYIVN